MTLELHNGMIFGYVPGDSRNYVDILIGSGEKILMSSWTILRKPLMTWVGGFRKP